MKKLIGFLVLAAVGISAYVILSDPQKRERIAGMIEGSTGVDLDSAPERIAEEAGRAVNSAAEKLMKSLEDTLSDPEFGRTLERWGENALEKLSEADLSRLQKELEGLSGAASSDYEAVLEKYLGEAGDS